MGPRVSVIERFHLIKLIRMILSSGCRGMHEVIEIMVYV